MLKGQDSLAFAFRINYRVKTPITTPHVQTYSVIKNIGDNPVYIGGPNVDPDNGFMLDPYETIALFLTGSVILYACCKQREATSIRVLEIPS